ncbi:MAG TPA: xanthine dehydrogenase molybdopterin binding subunit, partial [Caldithrix sp.]|nr:xanthine dehydrogenase molybdopterin binding subunit [Caldithrix sp.]
QLLVGKVVYSPHAHAKIKSFDLSGARQLPGVHAVLSYRDVPGENQMGPVVKDEPCLAEDEVNFIGQGVFLIAAESEEICREAERLIQVEYQPLKPILSIEEAIEKGNVLGPWRKIERGDVETALAKAPHRIQGELRTGAAEHWYLETQACLCVPGEEDELFVYSSTQHPSETQLLVSEVLGIPSNQVVVEVRRLGGAFGGKETQANHFACWTALLSHATRRPVKIRLSRDDDQIMTGKRHPYLIRYRAGFDDEGNILAVDVEQNSDGGAANDLSYAILERGMLHADNAYFIPNMRVRARVWKTNHPPNTAFRGFGGPQGISGMEAIIDRVARYLEKDAAEIRYKNFYGIEDRNTTHYGETVENNRLFVIYDQIMQSSEYHKRRKAVDDFNARHEFRKRGLALTPVKFGISFTTAFLNQAGALVNVYRDGTILVNHGGVEMGQGLNTKIMNIAAAEFGVSLQRIKVNATNTSKVPNTSATAASTGSDLNGMAVKNAIGRLKGRMAKVLAPHLSKLSGDGKPTAVEDVAFENDFVFDRRNPARQISFDEAIPICYLQQTSLSATGFYRTPGIGFDREKGEGHPFYYYAFGMAVSEVEVDVLTGFHKILRVDILHDVGESLNKAMDIGQIVGGFVQGVGWCTTEEIKWDEQGRLLTHSPDTYKIPSVGDVPADLRVNLLEGYPNPNTIRRSKAVGEPPLMLALSTWLAIKDAISAVANHRFEPEFSLPATNERILLSIEKLKKQMAEAKTKESV